MESSTWNLKPKAWIPEYKTSRIPLHGTREGGYILHSAQDHVGHLYEKISKPQSISLAQEL